MYHKLIITLLLFCSISFGQSELLALFDEQYTDVKTYGAVGDGVTDDWLAIQTAVNEKKDIQIGSSRLDTFIVSQPIYLDGNATYLINGVIKIMDGDSSNLTVDAAAETATFTVADGSKFAVGQWVSVSDTQTTGGWIYVRDAWRAFTSRIIEIDGNDITLESYRTGTKTFTIEKNAMMSHCQSVIIAEGQSNITIKGSGLILANRDNFKQVWPWDFIGKEEKRAAVGICVTSCDNVDISGLTVRDALLHNISVSAVLDSVFSSNIRLNNITAINGHDKNIIIKRTNNVWITNTVCDSATWEDGLIFYLDVTNGYLENITSRNNHRYGVWLGHNANNVTGTDITTSGNYRNGLGIAGTNITLSDITMSDHLLLSDVYAKGIENVNLSNVAVSNVPNNTDDYSVLLSTVSNSTITNLTITNCVEKSLWIGDNFVGTITGGGIYEPQGIPYQISLTADVTFSDFDIPISNFEIEKYNDWLSTDLSVQQIIRLDSLTSMLKDSLSVDSLRESFDRLWILANETSQAGLKSIIDTSHTIASLVSAPTFTQWEGFTGNGTSSYINTNYNASTQGITYLQNNASFGIYFRSASATASANGIYTTSSSSVLYTGNTASFDRSWINGSDFDVVDLTHAMGYKISTRTNTTTAHYINGAGGTATENSTAPPNKNFLLLAKWSNDNINDYSDGQISIVALGKYFDLTTHNKIKNCFEWYMDVLGKGVIP